MNGQPTASQKRFHAWCREFRCMLSSECAAIHHIGGAKMKLKGCAKPGEWFCIPLSWEWHQGAANAVHQNRKAFERDTGTTEKELWIKLISIYESSHGEKPMPEHEYNIIVARG